MLLTLTSGINPDVIERGLQQGVENPCYYNYPLVKDLSPSQEGNLKSDRF